MRKLFTGASAALAGLLLASPAAAQGEAETMMVLGGYTNYTVSVTKHPGGSVAEQEGNISIHNNTEIFFNGSGETDGGLQISARVELEGHTTSDQIDEHYITVSGGFGSLEVGANDSADERTATGIFYNGTAVDYWYTNADVVPGDTGAGAGYRGLGQNDGMGVVYTTPSLGGATFAIGYKPSVEGSQSGFDQYGDENLLSFGVNYSADLDGITFTGSFGYHTHKLLAVAATDSTVTGAFELQDLNDPTTDDDTTDDTLVAVFDIEDGDPAMPERTVAVWGIGVNLGFGDTTLYGRWQDEETDPDGDARATEVEIGSLAISHVIGPIKLGLGWVQATKSTPNSGLRMVHSETGDALAAAAAGVDAVEDSTETSGEGKRENEDTMIIGSVDYTLGGGATISGYVAWGETEQSGDTHEASATADAEDTGPAKDKAASADGTAFGVALNLAF